MTTDEAIRILDPKTTADALAEIEYYGGFSGREAAVKAVEDACLLAIEAMERSRWRSCSERLPCDNLRVLGRYKDNPFSPFRLGIVFYNGHGWVLQYTRQYITDVTHWMPLPPPPKMAGGSSDGE